MGLEPTRPRGHLILSQARLPFRHHGLRTKLRTVSHVAALCPSSLGGIRTHTEQGLSLLPLPLGYETMRTGFHRAAFRVSELFLRVNLALRGIPDQLGIVQVVTLTLRLALELDLSNIAFLGALNLHQVE